MGKCLTSLVIQCLSLSHLAHNAKVELIRCGCEGKGACGTT